MWQSFLDHFSRNAQRPRPSVDGILTLGVDAAALDTLRYTLAVFQRGEAGEGRIAKDIDRFEAPYVDATYRQALKFFVAEEGRHALLLGNVLRALGGTPLPQAWQDTLFVWARRACGIRLKLLVLLVAEVVAITMYQAIAAQLNDGVVRAALLDIASDEVMHLRFHRQFFAHAAATAPARWLFTAVWYVVGVLACSVVLVDHRRTMHALRLPRHTLVREMWRVLKEAGTLHPAATDVHNSHGPVGVAATTPGATAQAA